MAANFFNVPFGAVALTATTAKTVVGANPIANLRVRVIEVKVSFDGATSTAVPVLVEFGQCTFGANAPGTNSTTVTPISDDADDGETIQTACAKTWTAEPTAITVTDPTYVPAFDGIYHYITPLSAPLVIKNNKGFVVRCTAPANVDVSGKLRLEE